jgi:2-keto-myo-inositol isomerase
VQPAMEFLGFVGQLNTIEDAVDVMQRSGRPDATTILDPFHVFRGGGSVESIANLTADQIAISHFNDVPAEPPREQQHDPDRVMPGDGTFDLRRYLELLLATGYEGFLSLELFREDLWQQDPLAVAREGLEKMRQVVEG